MISWVLPEFVTHRASALIFRIAGMDRQRPHGVPRHGQRSGYLRSGAFVFGIGIRLDSLRLAAARTAMAG